MSEARMAGVMHAIRMAGGLEGLGLKKAHFGVLIVMAFFEDEVTGDCWPSNRTIGAWSGQDKSRMSTRRTELETMGYITEDKPKRGARGTAYRKYWKFNESIFPKVHALKSEMQHVGPTKCKMQHDIHCTTLQREKEELSKTIEFDFPFPSVEQVLEGDSDGEEGQPPPSYEPVGTASLSAQPVPEASSRQEEVLSPVEKHLVRAEEETAGPKHPVMLCLVDNLGMLGIFHPRMKESWPSYESDLQKRYTPEELLGFPEILAWAFTREHFRKAFADPKKKDLIRFFVDNTDDMREDFEVNRAKANVRQSILAARTEAGDDSPEEDASPVENREPTLPLGRLFLQCLLDIGVTEHDTSTWDAIEKSMATKCNAAQLLAAPEAMKLVLNGEDAYWSKAMFDGKKANKFRFFMNNLPKILRSIQDTKARSRLSQTPTKKESQDDNEEHNQWAGMVSK